MNLSTLFVKSVKCSTGVQVNISRSIHFEIVGIDRNGCVFQIQKETGDFKIYKILMAGFNIPYNRANKTFSFSVLGHVSALAGKVIEFHVLANINFQLVNYIDIPYHLYISAARIKPMRVCQCLEIDISLPGYDMLQFKCYIKKVKNDQVEIHILNPFEIIINDMTTDFRCFASAIEDINEKLVFVFDPVTLGSGTHQRSIAASAPPEYSEIFQDTLLEASENLEKL